MALEHSWAGERWHAAAVSREQNSLEDNVRLLVLVVSETEEHDVSLRSRGRVREPSDTSCGYSAVLVLMK